MFYYNFTEMLMELIHYVVDIMYKKYGIMVLIVKVNDIVSVPCLLETKPEKSTVKLL